MPKLGYLMRGLPLKRLDGQASQKLPSSAMLPARRRWAPNLDRVAGTSLDKGAELDALAAIIAWP